MDADVRRVVRYLCRYCTCLARRIDNDTVEPCPCVCKFFGRHAFRYALVGDKQHTLGTGSDNPVVKCDEAVRITLLVYHVTHKRMYLAVDERICLEHVRMALVFVRRFTLCQDVTKRTEEVVVPVTIHKPFGFDERYFLVGDAVALRLCQTLHVLGLYHRAVILNVYLEDVTIVVVMAAVSRFALLAPHLNHPASALVSRSKEVGIYPVTAVTEILPSMDAQTFVTRLSVYFRKSLVVLGRLGKLLAQIAKVNVVYLTHETTVPSTEVTHIIVDEEIVGLHIVSPALHLVIAPAVPLAMNHHAANKILLHASGIEFRHAV